MVEEVGGAVRNMKASAAARAARWAVALAVGRRRVTASCAGWSPPRAAIMYHFSASVGLGAMPSSPFS